MVKLKVSRLFADFHFLSFDRSDDIWATIDLVMEPKALGWVGGD